jgi:hypothetical protein
MLLIIEGHETAFNGFFEYHFTTGKPLEKPETDPQLL